MMIIDAIDFAFDLYRWSMVDCGKPPTAVD